MTPSPSPSAQAKDIVDTTIAAGDFTTLTKALTAAGLVDTLKGPGPFTVFAPTDEAFATLPKGTLDKVLADKKLLTKILTYHVVAGEVTADQVMGLDGKEVKTLEGGTFTVKVGDDGVSLVDGAGNTVKVTQTDIMASNGVIHVVDAVLMPN
ncbi:MAG: fasciclin domain-containing protein [Propionicimonas sp.]|uniref:fasciclin domain-containing protein n=1 Tax=Propionicimonas sp. TaxID=1955623 RepID=UPI003D133C25